MRHCEPRTESGRSNPFLQEILSLVEISLGNEMTFRHGPKFNWGTCGVLPLAENYLCNAWQFAMNRNLIGQRMAFCHEQNLSWATNGISPRAENNLASEWRFANFRGHLIFIVSLYFIVCTNLNPR